jgi:hypothetical protein
MATFWRTFHQDGKFAQAGKGGGGCTPTPFPISTITRKVVVYAPAERADTFNLFLLYPYIGSLVVTWKKCDSASSSCAIGPSVFLKQYV